VAFAKSAAVVVAISWTYAASRIHADHERTLEGERNRLTMPELNGLEAARRIIAAASIVEAPLCCRSRF
jgi:hypothetical protein